MSSNHPNGGVRSNIHVLRVPDSYPLDSLITAFKGNDAVVLVLPFELLSDHKKFAEASIRAGVRWLVASTYGSNMADPRADLFPASGPHKQAVKDLEPQSVQVKMSPS